MQKPYQAALDAKRSHTPVKDGIAPLKTRVARSGWRQPSNNAKRSYWWLGGVVVIGGGLRLYALSDQSGPLVPTRRADGVPTAWGLPLTLKRISHTSLWREYRRLVW